MEKRKEERKEERGRRGRETEEGKRKIIGCVSGKCTFYLKLITLSIIFVKKQSVDNTEICSFIRSLFLTTMKQFRVNNF